MGWGGFPGNLTGQILIFDRVIDPVVGGPGGRSHEGILYYWSEMKGCWQGLEPGQAGVVGGSNSQELGLGSLTQW